MRYQWITPLLGLLLVACETQEATIPETKAPQVLTVQTYTLSAAPWQGKVRAFGVVQAAEEVDVSVDFSGVVKAVHVDEGERIQRGQLLLELDPKKQQLRVQQARQAMERSLAAMDEARLNLERRQQLAEKKTVSREVLDNAKLALTRAAAQYRESMAVLQIAERELAESKLYSPVDGLVDKKTVETGEAVMAGAMLLKLQAVDSLEVQVWISEGDIAYLYLGAEADLTLNGLPGSVFTATVDSIGINADPRTGNFPVKLIFNQGALPARPGMTATVSIKGVTFADSLELPEALLVDRDRRRVVFVYRDGKVHQVEPVLGAGSAGRLLVLSGLQSGDQIIASSLDRMLDGMTVQRIADEPEANE